MEECGCTMESLGMSTERFFLPSFVLCMQLCGYHTKQRWIRDTRIFHNVAF